MAEPNAVSMLLRPPKDYFLLRLDPNASSNCMLSATGSIRDLPESEMSLCCRVPKLGCACEVLSPFFSKELLACSTLTVLRALETVATSISTLFIILATLVLHILVFLSFLNLLVELPYKVLLHIKKFFGNLLLLLA